MTPETFAGAILVLLFSIILHEVMHGLAALYFGDKTAQKMGRLTLNPLPHIDPIGSILLPGILLATSALTGAGGFLFGWAKPVPVNPLNFNNIRVGEAVVAIAGVAANLALAVLAAIFFHLFGSSLFFPHLANILSFAVSINLVLAFFNLLPIPPLDGSKLLATILPVHLEMKYRSLEKYGFLILLFILFTPLGNIVWGILRIFINFFHKLLGV
ncbi:hypothetical protein A3H85_02115 [Candidatus Daviesbacteria bacterium RIFCSPLOWO2_02_FULL_40_8]|uniref:Peptidase M50 domain-containing protein n=1 Tax=Candidatus Daviesbacteria bacterium RIFCSPLOWO2_01_FULL_40_24 TaxID=1797787 RepID=A0A1F5MJS7_9BACT|nr:MAG: hypothetical protein A2780_02860 [Candidatus Daviesbacteria bacterium RIFCSPHIGHO2_01_FULL_41_45]OGE35479.1 MAG: hypothetical protein A3C32_03435 [Candidatus Daviesbacteria bacterium RIFCSPHIGHO2_02_FULL_41_14]OGE65569.1 MAG: hypothetical protein A3B49_02015 [Candidatus Daviesbacteria bacterium RIFCSPLOWO2_01_FULL_40_24]OGE67143.1 MAG: hypothetical protein A3H85_02115 [Candidatus Daviesbacteria bacterium RIFCSPLOWO2_02_FULL_40_8]